MDLILSLLTLIAASLNITDATQLTRLQSKIEALDVKEQAYYQELYSGKDAPVYIDKDKADPSPVESPAINVWIAPDEKK
ncbi:MAG: hypothetical protein NTY88_09855 [Bacteroidetes bacterium]|nr:hypothetical protein [Bacteroidota bacterium]